MEQTSSCRQQKEIIIMTGQHDSNKFKTRGFKTRGPFKTQKPSSKRVTTRLTWPSQVHARNPDIRLKIKAKTEAGSS